MSQKLVCNCNGTMPLDAKALGVSVHRSLCRQEVGTFLKALDGSEELVVACTQEGALFSELAEQAEKPLVAPLRFVNIRESSWVDPRGKIIRAKDCCTLSACRYARG